MPQMFDISVPTDHSGFIPGTDIGVSLLSTETGLEAPWSRVVPWLREMVEVMPDAVFVIGKGGRIEIANRQAARMFGHTVAGMVGQTIDFLMPARLHREFLTHREAYLGAGDASARAMEGVEVRGLRADGSEFPAAVSIAPLPTPQGLWSTATVRDNTLAKQAEAEIVAARDELRAANRELEQFVAIASHDLKAPLRSLQGFARLLVRDLPPDVASDPDIADYLAFIAKSATHMQALLDGLLLYSRTGRETQPMARVECASIVGDVTSQLHALLTERAVQLDVESLPPVCGFALSLNQLFQNLIGNAVKFQPGASPRVRVWADAAADASGMHTIHVQDWGIGIAEEHQEAVFQIFQRLHDETEFEGTGVGLAVCARIVARHGGRLWLDSTPGLGSVFHFTLPGASGPASMAAAGPGNPVEGART